MVSVRNASPGSQHRNAMYVSDCGSDLPRLLYRRRLIAVSLATRLNLQVQITASLATWPLRLDSHAALERIWVSVMMKLERVAIVWLPKWGVCSKRLPRLPKPRFGGLRGPNLGTYPKGPWRPPKPGFLPPKPPKTPQKHPFLPPKPPKIEVFRYCI
jgi:hypothetical protein